MRGAIRRVAGILFDVSNPPEQVLLPPATRLWDLRLPVTERILRPEW